MAEFHYDTVPADQLKACEHAYLTEMECNGSASTTSQFNYAFCLVHAHRNEDIRKSIPLLQSLCRPGTDHRDYVYYLGVAYFRLAEYDKGLAHARRVLSMEPNNSQAKALHDAIQRKLKADGVLGMAITAGGVAIGVGVIAMIAGALARR